MRLSRHLRYGFCLVAPIFFALAGCSQAQEASSNVPQIAQIPPPSTTRLDPPANYVSQKNKVIMLGLIHSGHIESERFGLPVVEQLIRDIDPDYVLTEIPPDRLADAMKGFVETGEVTESRVRVFPEYKDVLFPLSREMDFKIIPTAAWSRGMADFRRAALADVRGDEMRKPEWDAYTASTQSAREELGDRGDDPHFIHTDAYDELTRRRMSVYATAFADDVGRGDWERINAAHYKLIEAALENHAGEGATLLITYGAAHKYWFLEQLRRRDDIILINPIEYLEK